MGSRIRILDDQTINKIAAGEVIENPASVVKELVENALDAGAEEVCVEIKEGGRQLIRITDDGCGMNRDDALLSLERHATSKLRAIEELHEVGTMGFRGEAIPSIASISKFTLLTNDGKSDVGTMIFVDGGKMIKCAPAPCSKGTTLEVKSLFFNVPVRKKFQRSPTYDSNEILKVFTIQALGHPKIKFQLIKDGKTALSTGRNEELEERIRSVLGSDFATNCCKVEHKKGDLSVKGIIGLPACTRHNRTGQYLFINNRAVFSYLVNYAVREGYGTTLPNNRHPIFVLQLTIPGGLVDINVHPQKREVRLRREQQIKEHLFEAVDKALQNAGLTYSSSHYELPEVTPVFTYEPTKPVEIPMVQEAPMEQPVLFEEPIKTPRVIAPLRGYLLLESENQGIRLVDQRAAHARVVFEKLLQEEGKIEVQPLLIPHTLEVTPIEGALLKENLETLNTLGIQMEEFGTNSFIVHAIPQVFGSSNIDQLITDIAETLQDSLQNERRKQIALAASRKSVSSKKELSLQEGQSLVNQLMRCKKPYQCPQGRPTMVEITHDEIKKQFQCHV